MIKEEWNKANWTRAASSSIWSSRSRQFSNDLFQHETSFFSSFILLCLWWIMLLYARRRSSSTPLPSVWSWDAQPCYLSFQKLVKPVFMLSRSKPSKAQSSLLVLRWLLSIIQHSLVQHLTRKLRQVYEETFDGVRRKQVLAAIVWRFAILKFLLVIESVHSCFKSQCELRILSVGSLKTLLFS